MTMQMKPMQNDDSGAMVYRAGMALKEMSTSQALAYSSWRAMRQRCSNQKCRDFSNWGGRGIRVCERWHLFTNFLQDMGEPFQGATLDRIDVNGHYEPGNCRWATRTEQARNTRNNVLLELGGVSRCINEWAEITGMNRTTIAQRLSYGWSVEKTLTTPCGSVNKTWKLKDADWPLIAERVKSGQSMRSVAKSMGVTLAAIRKGFIRTGVFYGR